MRSRQIGDGIRTYGGYVAEIEGDVLVASPNDVATMPDKGGRRYIIWQTIKNGPTDYPPGMGGGRGVNKIEKDLEKMLSGLVDKYDKYLSDFRFKVDPVLAWPMIRDGITTSGSNSGKVLHKAIADYLDGMEKVMKKHSKILHSIFTDYTKKRTLDPDPDSGDTAMWDELVVNNIKIKMIHIGENTTSTIISKGISAGKGQQTYRGEVKILKNANNARNYSQCDSMLIGGRCGAHTFPYIDVRNSTAIMEHEASTSNIGEEEMFYCNSRGIKNDDAVSMIVNGFCKKVFNELPMEFAIEVQKLMEISLEGSVG